jgi:ABC-2 type transport system permease protein
VGIFNVNKPVYDSRVPQDSLISTFRVVISRRILLGELIRIDLVSRYRRSVIGILWSFLNPLLISFIIYFVFGRVFNSYMPETRGYASWVVSGVLLQVLLLTGITVSSSGLQQNMSIISRNRIQPVLFALSSASAHMIHFLVGCLSLIPLALFTGQTLSLRIILLPFYCFCVVFWLTGIGLLLVGWFMHFDDALYLFNALLMIISYLSPFLYPTGILSDRLRTLVELNPITNFVMAFRWLVYENHTVTAVQISSVPIWSAFVFIAGVYWIRNRWNDYVML